ncbi:trypsin-like peptidase domain-containing protein [Paenarthrobacter sp. NCHU4564]|uniref:S1C family serine protease n=1 Tax=Paenarthrobacter sp. NCHU4564 TaxID=3451353 RepID=UPI003F9B3310
MTENPAQGAGPENREPSQPRQAPGVAPNAEAAEQAAQGQDQPSHDQGNQPYAPGGAEPVRDVPGRDANATAPLPAFHSPGAEPGPSQHPQPSQDQFRPSYPQRQPFHGAGPAQPHQGQGGSQANPTAPYGAHQGPYFAGSPGNAGHPYAQGPQHTQGGQAPAATRKKPAFGVGTLVASILAAGLVGGGVVAGSNALWVEPAPASSTGGQSSTVIVNNKDDVNVITAAAAKASPSVVTIKATSGGEGGTGSGIIIDDQGHILTNTHVVTLDGATANAAIEVRTHDGKVLKATVVGTDPLSDLAVIKVSDASGLVPATLGDSSKINVGDTAVAIGSPLGLTGTVTDGIVSTLNRTISVASSAVPEDGPDDSQGDDEGFQFAPPNGGQSQRSANEGSISINVIQTDAAINPGNSGGALVNSKGEIIGVNVAIASAGSGTSESSSGNIGVGFSVPINHAKRVAQEIIDNGKASHGQFGVSVRSKSSTGSDSGFSVGAEVAAVTADSAAAKAGIKVGDVVTKFGDYSISDPNQLTAAVREQPAGAKVKVTIQRSGQSQEIEVTLDAAQ